MIDIASLFSLAEEESGQGGNSASFLAVWTHLIGGFSSNGLPFVLLPEVEIHEPLSNCDLPSRFGRSRGFELSLKTGASFARGVEWVMPSGLPSWLFTESEVGGPLGTMVPLTTTGRASLYEQITFLDCIQWLHGIVRSHLILRRLHSMQANAGRRLFRGGTVTPDMSDRQLHGVRIEWEQLSAGEFARPESEFERAVPGLIWRKYLKCEDGGSGS